MKTFHCNFGKGIGATIQVADQPPKDRSTGHIQKVEWHGRPNLKCFRPYVAWINSVNKILADEWNVTLMHVFQMKSDWSKVEIWLYEPGKPPKILEQ